MLLIDAHVHIYDCFDLRKFFDSAYANFKFAAEKLGHGNDFTGILLLAETFKDNWFNNLLNYADGKELSEGRGIGKWIFRHTHEECSLCAKSADSLGLILIAGRQILTAEGLEVLALTTTESFKDGTPIGNLIEDIVEKGGMPVIPWGVGKWLGTRGKVVKAIINSNRNSSLYIGDNGNRPFFWPRSSVFKLAEKKRIHVLPGSDPLSLAIEATRVGTFGSFIPDRIDKSRPSENLKKLIRRIGTDLRGYGNRIGMLRFFYNQFKIRLKKKNEINK